MNFVKSYARFYDLLYNDKDYARECRYIIRLLQRHSARRVRSVLDIACGTGSHAFHLASLGMNVVACDLSADMISVARTKHVSPTNPRYFVRDIRNLGCIGNFDCATCMFAALNYARSHSDMEAILKGVHSNLKEGGLFLCDVWNGLAVLKHPPSNRIKYVNNRTTSIIRSSESKIDEVTQSCEVKFRLTIFQKGMVSPLTYRETHVLKVLLPSELKYIFSKNGFRVIDFHPFLKPKTKLTSNDWNMTIVAKKI